jgi:ATP-binding cassette subfamily B protein
MEDGAWQAVAPDLQSPSSILKNLCVSAVMKEVAMTLSDTLPAPLAATLEVDDELPLITATTDLTLDGSYGEEWLVIAGGRLAVYEPNGGHPQARHDLPLEAISAPLADTLVGGGALQVTVQGTPIDLLRYSNARQRTFSRVARYLEELEQYREARARGEQRAAPRLAEDSEEQQRCPACNLLLPEGSRVCPACMHRGRVILRLAEYLRPYWRQTVLLCLLILSSTGLGLVAPYLTRPLLDVVLVPQGAPLPAEQRLRLLGLIVLGMLAAQAAAKMIDICQGRLAAWLTHRLAHSLRMELYGHLQLLSLRYFDRRRTGALMARLTQDTRDLESVLTIGAQFFLANLLTLLGVGTVLALIDWRLLLLALAPAPFVTMLSRAFFKRIETVWKRWWHARSRLSAALNDTLSGVRVVKAFAQEQREIARFTPHSAGVAHAGYTAERTWMTLFPILTFVTGTGALLVWYVGGGQVLAGQVTPGTLLTFIAYLALFYGPLQFLNRVAEWLSQALAAAERVFDILGTRPDVREAAQAVSMPEIAGRVEFRDVTFGYEAHRPTLKRIDLDVAPGEMIGLVGHSGAGKSTSINLICRFYDVQEGQIVIDGVDIRYIRQGDLRSQIGVVLQETFLFNGTIAENIAYARPEAAVEEIMAAAKAANAHDFIVQKTDGYDTQVGERGVQLSGGERQRIAIARAILHNPRILILDEATSSVDTDTEQQIQEAIARLVKGRTTFAIAHRLSTLRNADRLVVLKEGRIAEIGTHDELLERRGEFHRLVQMQQEMARIQEVGR